MPVEDYIHCLSTKILIKIIVFLKLSKVSEVFDNGIYEGPKHDDDKKKVKIKITSNMAKETAETSASLRCEI